MKWKYYLITCFFLLPNIVFGNFLSDSSWLDLYKKIDSWYYDLEMWYLERELKWSDMDETIIEDLNKRARLNGLEECFSWTDLTVTQILQMHNDVNWTADILSKSLAWCMDKNWSMPTNTFNSYYSIVNESYIQNYNKAQTKVDNIYKIWRIWMYSDGIEENSPFDLMTDLDEINSIIFEEYIPYNWVNNYDIWGAIDGMLSWLYEDDDKFINSRYYWPQYPVSTPSLSETVYTDEICIDNNQAWLTEKSYRDLINQNKTITLFTWWTMPSTPFAYSDEDFWDDDIYGYDELNDNWVWPCNNFFCIMIDFVTYNHELLGWSTNLSIEWLFKRSNNHLKKFAATSLIQSKMSINLFELWLKDLNLPDLFHVWIQVSYKPAPLLNVNKKNTNKSNTDYEYSNLFARYYRNLWLDYERANDLSIFQEEETKLKSILDTQDSPTSVVSDRFASFYNYMDNIKKQNQYVSSTIIDNKIWIDDTSWFNEKYIELESFTRALMEYTIWAKWIIREMNKIPQWG